MNKNTVLLLRGTKLQKSWLWWHLRLILIDPRGSNDVFTTANKISTRGVFLEAYIGSQRCNTPVQLEVIIYIN